LAALVGGDDQNCMDHPACTGIEDCYSGLDLDGDGLAQCDDPDCQRIWDCGSRAIYSAPFPIEWECGDGRDDDGDGASDCADSDCQSSPLCEGGLTEDAPATTSERRKRA
jgi:hypothetical protein